MDIAAVVAGLDALDVAALTRVEVHAAYGSTRRVRGWVDVLEGRLARRLEDIAATDHSIFPDADIAAASKTSRSQANRAKRRAATLADVPQLEGALGAGDVSSEHVDALDRAARRLKAQDRSKLTDQGERLAAIASRTTPEEFETQLKVEIERIDSREGGERLLRQKRAIRLRSWTDRDTGMVVFRGELDPETGTLVMARIDRVVDRLFREKTPDDCPTDPEHKQDYLRAAALTRLVLRRSSRHADATADTTADAAGAEPEPARHADEHPEDPGNVTGLEITDFDNSCEMMVVIDLATLIGGLHDHSIVDNGTGRDLPVESYRRMACKHAIIPVVLDSNGVVVDLGRDVRLANRAQRRAIVAMYQTCGIPGCTVSSRHCEPHHIIWWRPPYRGPTDLANLLPLCSRHHHAVHEGGWQLVMHPDRSLTITDPEGRVQHSGPPAEYQPGRGDGRRRKAA